MHGALQVGRFTRSLVRFSVSTRIWIAGLAVGAPITGMMLFLLVTGVNHDIDFAEAERAGNRYQRPLEALLRHIPAHGVQAARERAGAASPEARQAIEAEIETAFTALERAQAEDGISLQFTPAGLAQRKRDHLVVSELRREWKALVSSSAPSAADAYAHLVADLRGMIAHAGDTSNLILDPDLDSYYTMDVTLLALPQTQDRLAQMIALGQSILPGSSQASATPDAKDQAKPHDAKSHDAKKHDAKAHDAKPHDAKHDAKSASTASASTATPASTLSEEDRRRLMIFAAMLQEADHDRIAADVQTALNEDPNFGGRSDSLQTRLPAALADYSAATTAFITMTREISTGAREVTAEDYVAAGTKAREASFALWDVSVDELDNLLDVRIAGFKGQRITGLTVTSIALACSALLVLLITRSITVPLEHTSEALWQAADEISSASDQLAASAHNLSAGAQSQAQSLEETVGTMNEISSLASGNADRSRSARELMMELGRHTDESSRMLDEMVRGMDAIRGSSDGIARIIRTIDEIAFQTNVLSLNAAVEAARAGRAGAGFAVVADEVRSLAQRSADAAHETGSLIDASRVTATEGAEHVGLVVKSIAAFIQRLSEVRGLIDEIDGASRNQAHGVRQVAEGVGEVERGVQSASATAEETAAASEELASQAAVARAFVEDLRTAIRGTRHGTRPNIARHPGRPPRPERPARDVSEPHADLITSQERVA